MKLFRDGWKRRLTSIFSAFDRKDSPALQYLFGLSLLGYGASQFQGGLGPVIVGVVLILTSQPLTRWIK